MALRRAFRRGNAPHNRFEHVRHALAGFGANQQRIGGIEADRALDHFLGALDVGALQINLVDHGNNLEAVIDRQIRVCQRLRFHALRRVHHEQRAFAGG